MTLQLRRNEGKKANLKNWGFGDLENIAETISNEFYENLASKLNQKITDQVEQHLDIIFSERGADVLLEISTGDGQDLDNLNVEVSFCIQEFESYASSSIPLKELLEYELDSQEQRVSLAKALRKLADDIEQGK